MDVDSGRVLYEHNADKQMLIASTTKILTALVAVEAGELSDTVKVSREAAFTEGSAMYLKEGETLTLETLLYGLLLCSGNDAAVAIADHVGGSQEGFVRMMNETAQELGIPREEVVFAMDAIVDPVSLYEPVYSDGGDAICVMDQVSDTRNTDEAWTDRIALKEAMKRLDDRERRILSLRFYEGKTQMEVSAEVGISQAQVSRLEKGAINTIKKNI